MVTFERSSSEQALNFTLFYATFMCGNKHLREVVSYVSGSIVFLNVSYYWENDSYLENKCAF